MIQSISEAEVRLYLSRKEKFLLISCWSDVMEDGDDSADCTDADESALIPTVAGVCGTRNEACSNRFWCLRSLLYNLKFWNDDKFI